MDLNVAHHIKGIRPALNVMEGLGYDNASCLLGSGITTSQLEQPELGISLQQEFSFYRRLLALSGNPLIGLQLGQAYKVEHYGVLGYAILSAQTLGEALKIASEFGSLSFSHFRLDFAIENSLAHIIMRRQLPIETGLMAIYEDRDASAILAGAMAAVGQRFPVKAIKLMHDGEAYKTSYEAFFQCPVSFNNPQMEVIFEVDILNTAMPLRDSETSEYCRQQCQQLLNKLTQQSNFVDEVRRLLFATPTYFPTINEVATLLNISERSLRRNLQAQGQQFHTLLNEARYQLAKEYLDSNLSLERIANLLGYSEAANFSHAFKRWSGLSPRAFRNKNKPKLDS